MTWRTKAWTLFGLATFCALAVSACGSGDSAKPKRETSVASGTSGASGAAGTTGRSATTGTSGPTGGASAPGHKTSKSKKQGQSPSSTGTSGSGSSQQSAPATGKKNAGSKKVRKKGGNGGAKQQTGPPSSFTAQQKELYKEAKLVCHTLTLDGLAKEYVVKKSPDAVARAYSKAYDVTLRPAVYLGCKAGVSKK